MQAFQLDILHDTFTTKSATQKKSDWNQKNRSKRIDLNFHEAEIVILFDPVCFRILQIRNYSYLLLCKYFIDIHFLNIGYIFSYFD